MLYVLDEPSIGLHQRDNDRLLETLKRLRDLGNTVIVVEHDEDAIRAADYLVDMGPGAGVHGGNVVAAGHARGGDARPAPASPASTCPGCRQIPIPASRAREPTTSGNRWLTVKGATGNNLQNVDGQHPARHLHLRHRRVGQRQVAR